MDNVLQQPVTQIKGIGEETSEALQEMGIKTIEDLLMHFPYRYEDYELRDLADVKHDEKVTVEGKVHSEPSLTYYTRKKSRLTFRLLVGRYLITVVCFNRPYLKGKLSINETVTVTGKWNQHRQTITASELKLGALPEKRDLEPVYSIRGALTVKGMRRFIKLALEQFGEAILDPLPETVRNAYRLVSKKEAIRAIHFPRSHEELKQARRRLVYEEFLLFQLKIHALRKVQREHSKGIAHTFSMEQLQEFIQQLPFPLTGAQKRVVQEIIKDMQSPYRMNRLLQGDVGSGKTVVAAIALYATVLSGYQGALMVPTEILAEQHAQSLQALLAPADVSIALLTSSIKGKKRKEVLEKLASGDIDIIIGTHALIQDEVNFHQLGLVITDEQHRFGVEQRRILREKGESPDVLFMTATPIPRTLAITAFGEMDVSIIDEMPAGRKKVQTYWVKHHMLERVLDFIEKEVQKGRQAYVICPLIEESEKLDVQNAIDVHSMLTHYYRGKYQIGLMHGRLSSEEKDEVMKAFSQNHVQILVSTTVVEVGVNVPNATVMVIYDAERFGLAQLHQLRGRVGRGDEQSYCILVADPKSEAGKERMRIMTETTDGFVLSEKDLELRGPGDFFGTKQSGMPEFKLGDVVHDYRILEVARSDAAKLIYSHAFWNDSSYEALRLYLQESGVLHGEKLD
ncbi:ATP-dependent DNA helicase RecG [Thermaerobacillus caldiproteolyticus]|uniref:ATP-dependent DNA helicase RecG n=1 Tax=Thermaerobacillus caldiproteolyticus TaxID=247480 RepID=A0A7W0BZE3_9BACL|nr:ATP-dependent DNA helicase RecG [Anoxybacillus caldiproteolyticus]MBA2874029.1 ATP-dependent DNA helicase RecG [Anoxybacillus caldiproteolyticus]